MKQFLLTFMALVTLNVSAQKQITVGDFTYTATGDNSVELTSANKLLTGDVVIPGSIDDADGRTYRVTAIGESVFMDRNGITSVSLPEGLVEIKYDAFSGLGLTSITFPSTLKKIGRHAFAGNALKQLEIPGNVEYIGTDAFFGYAWGERQIQSLKLNEGLKYIGPNAFYGNLITEVTIPSTVDTIGDKAFLRNLKLAKVVLNEGTRYMGDGAFNQCLALESINLPSSLTYIGAEAFLKDKLLSSINIPASLEEIGESAFASTGISRYDVDATNAHFKVVDGCLYSRDGLRLYAVPMTGVTIVNVTEGTQAIMGGAFWGSGVTQVRLPESVFAIGYGAFQESPLEKINLPSGISYLDELAFAGTNLTEVTYPESAIYIYEGTFAMCPKLTKVTLSSGLKAIDIRAFRGADALKEVVCNSSIAPHLVPAYDAGEEVFTCATTVPLYVPKGSADSYRFEGWDAYLTITETDKGSFDPIHSLPADSTALGKWAPASFELEFDADFTVVNEHPTVYIRENTLQYAPYKTFEYGWNTYKSGRKLTVFAPDMDGATDIFMPQQGKCYYVTIPAGIVRNAAGELNEQITLFYYGPGTDTGISAPNTAGHNAEVVARYNLAGQSVTASQKGIQIVRFADGSTRKVVVR